jgi:hypothetical protein
MTHYLKRIVTLKCENDGRAFGVTGAGLGYKYWLIGTAGTGAEFCAGSIIQCGFRFNIHPFIRATAQHAEALGVKAGQYIAGIRWVENVDDAGFDISRHPDGTPVVGWDRHLARLEADADAEEADRTEPDTGELVRRQAEAEADTRDDEELEAAGDILAEVVDRSPGVKVQCKSCDARFDTHAEFNRHATDCPGIVPVISGESFADYAARCDAHRIKNIH